jgi:ADP-ribosylglycohydrolase
MTPTLNRDRFRGALLGLAVGDAVGTTVEFKRPGSFAPVSDMVGGGQFGLQPGEWTDDTSTALCLAESLIECGGFDPTDQLERYIRWYRHGHFSSTGAMFDIGNATRASLERFERTSEPFPGSTDDRTAGNGSIMRLAPVALFFARGTIAEVTDWAAESSRTTHGATQAVDACRVLGALIAAAVCGASKQDLLKPNFWQWGDLDPAVAAVAAGSWRDKQPPAINGSGWCVESLEAALWALGTTDSFESGCLAAVNLGDDADTTAAVYGQIAGAVYGELAIPAHWRRKLAHAALISRLTDQLWDAGQAAATMPTTASHQPPLPRRRFRKPSGSPRVSCSPATTR